MVLNKGPNYSFAQYMLCKNTTAHKGINGNRSVLGRCNVHPEINTYSLNDDYFIE